MTEVKKQVWFVTGANKGLGAAIAHEALDHGYHVVAAARNPENVSQALGENPDLFPVRLDLTDPAQIKPAVRDTIDKFGRIDVLVNNAGYGLLGYFEELSDDSVRRQMETNVFGPFHLTREILPFMRERGSGWVVNISSTSGIKSVEGGSVYSASKFAVEGWTEGLAIELKPFGIRCMIVEPGAFRTDFFNPNTSFTFSDVEIAGYDGMRGDLHEHFVSWHEKQKGNPAKLAQALMTAMNSENPPLRLLCGKYAAESIDQYLAGRRAEFDAWRKVTESTDFE